MDTRKLNSSRWLVTVLSGMLIGITLMTATAHGQSEAEKVLVEKARSLDARGRSDLALQSWQQVLLSDPTNADALAGVAKAEMQTGKTADAQAALDKLRTVSPNDPRIAQIESMKKQRAATPQLAQAGKLAESGQYAQAMAIYRQAYGTNPPAGDIAVAYYETEASTDDAGRNHAIAGLRNLARQNPGDPRYSITLGRLLTYKPQTRPEGIGILQRYPKDSSANEALRQALTWDSANPTYAGSIRNYLKAHPDKDLQARLSETESKQAHVTGDFAKTAPERAAYAALRANNLPVAEDRFNAIKAKEPNNPRVLTGLGFVAMKKNDFGSAITDLDAAKANGAKGAAVDNALATSHFWFVMSEANNALDQNQMDVALAQYRKALDMRPSSPEALAGLAGALLRAGQPGEAVRIYAHLAKVQPGTAGGWRGLFTAQYLMGDSHAALQTVSRFPPPVRQQLAHDPEYLTNLAAAYNAVGDQADSQRVLALAMEIPFPDNGTKLKPDSQLQFAALLAEAGKYDKATGLYLQVLAADPNNAAAYQGLIRSEHMMGNDAQALTTLEQMPPPVLAVVERDPGFLGTVAAIYQSQGKLDVAQQFLEQASANSTAGGKSPSANVQLELAGIYAARGNTQAAYAIYQQILTADPKRLDAWKGLISALHTNGSDREAIAELRQIPATTMVRLNNDPQFLQVLASAYNGIGDSQAALVTIRAAAVRYQAGGAQPPAGFAIQYSYLLMNAGDDQGLYVQLMQLGSRTDLTDDQRTQVQTVWAVWSVRRAAIASRHNNYGRAVQILDAANRAFPNNPDVQKALAGGYQQAGQSKRGEAIYLQMDWNNATSSDYRAAVGSALAAHDMKQAQVWLETALKQFPSDPALLQEAAQYEQAKGDIPRAAEYYKAALDALGPADPAQSLIGDMKQKPDAGSALVQTNPSQELINQLVPGSDAIATQPMPMYPMYPAALPGNYLPGQAPVPVQIDQNGTPVAPVYGAAYGAQTPVYGEQYDGSSYGPQPVHVRHKSRQSMPQPMQQPTQQPPQNVERLGDYNPPQSSLTPADICALNRMAGVTCNSPLDDSSGWTIKSAVWQTAAAPASNGSDSQPAQSMHLRMISATSSQPSASTPSSPAAVLSSVPASGATTVATSVQVPVPGAGSVSLAAKQAPAAPYSGAAASVSAPQAEPAHSPLAAAAVALPQVQVAADATRAAQPVAESTQASGHMHLHMQQAEPAQTAHVNSAAADTYEMASAAPPQTVIPTLPPVPAQAPVPVATINMPTPPMPQEPSPVTQQGVTPSATAMPAPTPSATQMPTVPQVATPSVPSTPAVPAVPTATDASQSVPMPVTAPTAQAPASAASAPMASTPTATTPAASGPVQVPVVVNPPAPAQPYTAGPAPSYSSSQTGGSGQTGSQSGGAAYGQSGPVGYGTYSQGAGQRYNPGYGPGYSGYNDTASPVQQQPYYVRTLPTLSGPYSQSAQRNGPQNQRDEITDQLAALQGGYSPWIGATGLLSYRSGTPGFDRFVVFQTPIEGSAVINDAVRATIVLRPVLIDSGTPQASPVYRLGTLPLGAVPPSQTASGISGEIQLRSANYGISGGYTPYGFVVGNFIGSVYAHPNAGPFTLSFTRDSITDTQLSYSGLHDTGQASRPIWGGVVANAGEVQYAATTDHSGYYLQGGAQYITGKNVLDNWRADGDAGAYWRIATVPGAGSFTLGMNFFAMHYEHNLRYFTFGQGGYFSPDAYILANIPVTFNGHYGRNFHYRINGSLGVQGFQEDSSPYFPTSPTLQAQSGQLYPTRDSISGNYLIDAEAAYRVSEHWFIGALVTANNSRDYNTATVGFYVRYMFRSQFPTEEGPPTGIFPATGLRPVQVP